MNLKVRLTQKEDYTELCEWWKWHRFTTPSLDLLDNLRFGLMVSIKNINICAGFIYFTNAKAYALMEYIVSSHKVKDKKIRQEAIQFLIYSLQEMAKQNGVQVLFSSLRNPHLIKHYEECGFIKGSKNTTEMICPLASS